MIWLWITLWAVVAALACGLAFLLLVGRAFGTRQSGVGIDLPGLVLGVGLKLGMTNPLVLLPTMWGMWTAIGACVIVLVLAS